MGFAQSESVAFRMLKHQRSCDAGAIATPAFQTPVIHVPSADAKAGTCRRYLQHEGAYYDALIMARLR